MKKAFLIKEQGSSSPYYLGKSKVWRVVPPLQGHSIVITSPANVPFSGPETLIFPGYKNGRIKDFGDLDGSQKGILDNERVLQDLGYKILKEKIK